MSLGIYFKRQTQVQYAFIPSYNLPLYLFSLTRETQPQFNIPLYLGWCNLAGKTHPQYKIPLYFSWYKLGRGTHSAIFLYILVFITWENTPTVQYAREVSTV